jgi:hypothetical protein
VAAREAEAAAKFEKENPTAPTLSGAKKAPPTVKSGGKFGSASASSAHQAKVLERANIAAAAAAHAASVGAAAAQISAGADDGGAAQMLAAMDRAQAQPRSLSSFFKPSAAASPAECAAAAAVIELGDC